MLAQSQLKAGQAGTMHTAAKASNGEAPVMQVSMEWRTPPAPRKDAEQWDHEQDLSSWYEPVGQGLCYRVET